jgi:hypothetical protein
MTHTDLLLYSAQLKAERDALLTALKAIVDDASETDYSQFACVDWRPIAAARGAIVNAERGRDVLLEAMRRIQSQCAGNSDELSCRVWLEAFDAIRNAGSANSGTVAKCFDCGRAVLWPKAQAEGHAVHQE